MKSGYESIIWINDKHGSEYVCSLEALESDFSERRELTPKERSRCFNVNEIIGTERW